MGWLFGATVVWVGLAVYSKYKYHSIPVMMTKEAMDLKLKQMEDNLDALERCISRLRNL